jgi:hypothetical protein
MTVNDFNLLSLEDKKTKVSNLGLFLDNYLIKEVNINCYTIDKFFVEVQYDVEQNIISDVTAFETGINLYKYSNLGKNNWDKGDIFLVIFLFVTTIFGLALMR